MKWIDIKFAVPASNGKYMVFDGCFYVAWLHKFKNGKIKWRSPLGGCCLDHVTHWAPLPDSPK